MTTAAKLTRLLLVLAAAPCALLLAGCGESESEKFEKAKAEVCKSRTAIEQQVKSLKALPLSVGSVTSAEKSLEVIEQELKKIKEEAPKLKPETKAQVEKSTSEFTTEVTKIAETLGSSLTPSNAVKEVETATAKLLHSYEATLGTLSCS
jgi:ABC-type Zn uptake system ZnuABC Zn-binding protein ZnuA